MAAPSAKRARGEEEEEVRAPPDAGRLRAAMLADGYVLVPLLSAAEVAAARAAAETLAAATLADPLQSDVNSMATLRVRTNPVDGVAYAEHVPRLDLYGAPVLQDVLTSGRLQVGGVKFYFNFQLVTKKTLLLTESNGDPRTICSVNAATALGNGRNLTPPRLFSHPSRPPCVFPRLKGAGTGGAGRRARHGDGQVYWLN